MITSRVRRTCATPYEGLTAGTFLSIKQCIVRHTKIAGETVRMLFQVTQGARGKRLRHLEFYSNR